MENKKQLFEIFTGVCNLNENIWGNTAGSYDDAKEAAYQIEEALEGFHTKAFMIPNVNEWIAMGPKDFSRYLISRFPTNTQTEMDDVDRFDKALDAIYFAIGSMHKLGLTPHQMTSGLAVVHNANLQKTGKKDAEGKVTKPEGFVPPEELLQEILDARQ